MKLKIIILMAFVIIIYGDTYFPINSRIISLLKSNSNIDLISQKNLRPEINGIVISRNEDDKILFFSFENQRKPITRSRRTIHGWTIEKPISIEEPKFILIEETDHSRIGDRQFITNREDPFYIARGKRIAMEYLDDYERGKKSYLQRINKTATIPKLKINFPSKWNNSDLPINFYPYNTDDESEIIQNNGIKLRDKHSDIMDMLQEPFVISRGKKKLNKKNDYKQFSDSFEFTDDNPSRKRRGKLFDQLMKEKDPFYVARGKRNSPILHSQL